MQHHVIPKHVIKQQGNTHIVHTCSIDTFCCLALILFPTPILFQYSIFIKLWAFQWCMQCIFIIFTFIPPHNSPRSSPKPSSNFTPPHPLPLGRPLYKNSLSSIFVANILVDVCPSIGAWLTCRRPHPLKNLILPTLASTTVSWRWGLVSPAPSILEFLPRFLLLDLYHVLISFCMKKCLV